MSLAEIKETIRQAAENGDSPRELMDNLPIVSEPRCNICRSEFRPLIDRMIAGPYTYAAIARQFIGKDENLRGDLRNKRDMDRVRKSIERHAKNHVTVRDRAIREIIEARALEEGMLADDTKNSISTTYSLLELYVQKGFEEVTKSGAFVKHQDILEAVKMIEEMKRDSVSEQLDIYKRQVDAISRAVKEIVPPELHPKLGQRAQELFENRVIEIRELEAVK